MTLLTVAALWSAGAAVAWLFVYGAHRKPTPTRSDAPTGGAARVPDPKQPEGNEMNDNPLVKVSTNVWVRADQAWKWAK